MKTRKRESKQGKESENEEERMKTRKKEFCQLAGLFVLFWVHWEVPKYAKIA